MSDNEIHTLWQAAGHLGSLGALGRLALLLGLRRGELAQLERALDLLADRIVVRPEHANAGAQHEVPLTPLMREVIAGAPSPRRSPAAALRAGRGGSPICSRRAVSISACMICAAPHARL